MEFHTNNFNLLRLAFALFVVISHSYPISGEKAGDCLFRLTNGQVSFSYFGICGFFAISGYLVFQSLERNKTILSYFRNRILRVYPGLFVVLLLTVFFGILIYNGDPISYFNNKTTWTYLPLNLSLVRAQGEIEGIFTFNPYNATINGSLWSLQYEVAFYIILSLLFFLNRSWQLITLMLILVGLVLSRIFLFSEIFELTFILNTGILLEYAPHFFFGSLLAIIRIEKLWFRAALVMIAALAIILSLVFGYFYPAKFILLPLLVVLFGLMSFPQLNKAILKLGDISYGVYIYSFPIQQTLMYFWQFNSTELMLWSAILSITCGYFSWHFVEKKALQYKSREQR